MTSIYSTDENKRVSDDPFKRDYSARKRQHDTSADRSAEHAKSAGQLEKWDGKEPVETFSIRYRPFEPTDERIIRKSWFLKSRADYNQFVPADVFERGMHNRFNLLASQALTIIACDEECPAFVLGYLVFTPSEGAWDPLLCHWLYVKHAYRKQGIARGLLRQAGNGYGRKIYATAWNRETREYAKKNPKKLFFNPFALDVIV